MITLEHIRKKFDEKEVLKDISLSFQSGKLYVIKGVSGCGKTTLLNILSGLDQKFSGRYCYCGKEITSKNWKEHRQNIGYIFQQSLLISHFNIKENLLFICDDLEKINRYAKKFHVEHLMDKMPSQLSGGERQRIAMIRAMLLDTEIIIADEPTASLDYETSLEIARMIAKLKDENKIVIVATHENCFDALADEIVYMNYGTVELKKDIEIKENKKELPKDKHRHSSKKLDWKYAKLRNKSLSKGSVWSLILVFTLFILLSGFYFHGKEAYLNKLCNDYPYQTITYSPQKYEFIKNKEDIENIPLYSMEQEGIQLKNWVKKEYSSLNIPGVLAYGTYPASPQEAIIHMNAAKQLFPDTNLKEVVGKTIEVNQETITISAVLTSDLNMLISAYKGNPNYSIDYKEPVLFLSDEVMQKLQANPYEEKGLYILHKITPNSFLNEYVKDLNETSYYFEIKSGIEAITILQLYIGIGFLVFLSFAYLFLTNTILMDLYYRKLELGYLQLFQISKVRLYKLVFYEYLQKISKSLVCSLIITGIVFIGFVVFFHFKLFLSPLEFIFVVSIIGLYFVLLILLPLHKILKKDILFLIK